MSSERKIEANRENAKKSRGPRYARGKSHSRFNALETGVYADVRLLSASEALRLHRFRQQVWAQYKPVGIAETTVADELAFNLLRRDRIEWSERAFFNKVYGMELARLEESLTRRERELFIEVMAKGNPVGRVAVPTVEYEEKIPGPPETDEEIKKRLEMRIAMVGELQHLVEHAHLAPETMAIKDHLDRQRRAIFKDTLANIKALTELQRERLCRDK